MLKSDTKFNYCFVNERAIQAGFYLTGAGVERVIPHDSYPIPTHPEMYDFSWNIGRTLPEYQFILITSGQGEFESRATGLVPVRHGTGIFLLPDTWHRYRPLSAIGWACYWISFNGSIAHLWQQSAMLSPSRAIQKIPQADDVIKTLADVHRMVLESPESPAPASLLALGMLAGIFASGSNPHAQEAIPETQPTAIESDPLLQRALEIIWNHSHRHISTKVIAKQLGVSGRTLERHFRQLRRRSVLQEITECRISRARLMLESTHLPIKHVAYAAGFRSANHLIATFRRNLKATPGQVRNRTAGLGRASTGYKSAV